MVVGGGGWRLVVSKEMLMTGVVGRVKSFFGMEVERDFGSSWSEKRDLRSLSTGAGWVGMEGRRVTEAIVCI